MSTDEQLREAGAILPGKAPKGERSLDAITARAYAHPALEDRVVVRLVPAALGEAEDLSMEFLGFAGTSAQTVGHGRRQALGFPAWALVNDPANGRHALALVKDMERLARVARSKPGNAKDGYDALAHRLGGAAPHFLPTYWEQAGRAFIAGENGKMAGTCFAAARQAEQVHGLPVDEERLRDVHLEFAFAGALTAKAVSEYARQVAQRRPAAEAYDLVRAIAVRRVAGGLPPYVAMADDLKRLAKAAGLKPDAEAETVIGEIIAYPAAAKSHEGFWKAYRPALKRLCKRDPVACGRLLALLPDPPGYGPDATDWWLEMLDDVGALDALRAPSTAPEGALPTGGVAAWVQRFLDHRYSGWRRRGRVPRWLALLDDLLPTVRDELAASGKRLRACGEHLWSTDLDVLDACLAAGVPVEKPDTRGAALPVDDWFKGVDEGRRDLMAIAADERFLPELVSGLRNHLGVGRIGHRSTRRHELAKQGRGWRLEPAGLRVAARTWLAGLVGRIGPEPTVLTLANLIDEVSPVWVHDGVELGPELFAAIAGADIDEALARVLRGGVVTELGWPAYAQVRTELGAARELAAWPDVVLFTEDRAMVLAPDGQVTLDHAFRLPAGLKLPSWDRPRVTAYVDGQLRVEWRDGAYWSGRPTEIVAEVERWRSHYGSTVVTLPLPGGGRTTGDRPYHAGDAKEPAEYQIISDGQAYWRYESGEGAGWREYDPATGAVGRASVPAFFDVELADGDRLAPGTSRLWPAPEAFSASPMGWRDGLVGWRVVRHADGSQTGTGIDGRTVHLAPDDRTLSADLIGAFRLPGDDRLRPVTMGGYTDHTGETGVQLWDADGRQPVTQWSSRVDLPGPAYWHALRPRDEAGSRALRAADAGLAARLLKECEDATADKLQAAANSAVASALGEITDERVAAGVAAAVVKAEQTRRLLRQAGELIAAHAAAPAAPVAEEPAAAPAVREVGDGTLRELVSDLDAGSHYYGHGRGTLREQVRRVGTLLAGGAGDAEMPTVDGAWTNVVPWLGAVIVRAASPTTSAEERKGLIALLRVLSEFGFVGADPRVRVLEVTAPKEMLTNGGGAVLRTATSTLVILSTPQHYYGDPETWLRTAVEYSPTGQFAVPPKVFVRRTQAFTGWGDPTRLAAAIELAERLGAAPVPADAADRLAAATGMSRAEAALLIGGLPRLRSYEANFLTPEQRAILGVKATEARAARDSLRELPTALRLALLDAAMPADPADLWRNGPDIDAVARTWTERFGVARPVSDELLAEASKLLGRQGMEVVRTLANPTPGDWLHTDGTPVRNGWSVAMSSPHGTAFGPQHAGLAPVALAWLAYRLPVGDPVRAALPAAYRLVRERLRNGKLQLGHGYYPRAAVPAGMPALAEGDHQGEMASYSVRPAALSGPDDPALAFVDESTAYALRLLLGPELAATMASIQAETLPTGRFAQDPTVSVPDLVEAVSAARGLSAAAAAYYLQLLALPDPTDKRVAEWNEWKPARFKAARAELAATDLVVEAKRERAGRTLFLPGGWLALKAPNMPIEAWKSGLQPHGGRVLVASTVAELFRTSWARVVDGDAPRYHSLSEAR